MDLFSGVGCNKRRICNNWAWVETSPMGATQPTVRTARVPSSAAILGNKCNTAGLWTWKYVE